MLDSDPHRMDKAGASNARNMAAVGERLIAESRWAEAISVFEAMVGLDPRNVGYLNKLGVALAMTRRTTAAIERFQTAHAIDPAHADTLNNLGLVLESEGRPDEALAYLLKARELEPRRADVHCNIGKVCMAQRRPDDAIEAYDAALALQPDAGDLQLNKSYALLLKGEFEEGWRLHDGRIPASDRETLNRLLRCPAWQGEASAGKRIVVIGEQGFGDQIQFLRLIVRLAESGMQVDLVTRPELASIAARAPGVHRAVTELAEMQGQRYDYWCFMMSLPRWLGFDPGRLAPLVPYLGADARKAAIWQSRLPARGGLRAGLVWAAGDLFGDHRRNVDLEKLAPLMAISGIHWISLQKGPAAADLTRYAGGAAVHDASPYITDFDDTAAILANVDLVVTVDTSVAHLAGAMGVPVWMLCRFDGCWRWLMDRDDSPWYPSMKVFRQAHPMQWEEPIAAIARELQQRVLA